MKWKYSTLVLIILTFSEPGFSQSRWKEFYRISISGFSGVGSYTTFYKNGNEQNIKNENLGFNALIAAGFTDSDVFLSLEGAVEKWKDALLFPINLNFTFNIADTVQKLTPFITASGGFSFGKREETEYDSEEKGGLVLAGGLGVTKKINQNLAYFITAFYKVQKMRSSFQRIINPYSPEPSHNYLISYKFIGISLGANF